MTHLNFKTLKGILKKEYYFTIFLFYIFCSVVSDNRLLIPLISKCLIAFCTLLNVFHTILIIVYESFGQSPFLQIFIPVFVQQQITIIKIV